MTAALATRNNGIPPKPLSSRPQAALPVGEEDTADPVEATDVEPDEKSEIPVPVSAKSREPRKPPPTPEPIEVDLTGGDMPFQQFCDERNITTTSADTKKHLVSAAWMKEYRQTPTIEAGHIYSIFKMMKWTLPADIGGPLRTMKGQKKFTTPERGKFAINHLGENEVKTLVSQQS